MTSITSDDAAQSRHLPEGLLPALRADPQRALLTLSLAAIDTFGSEAREYAARVQAEHPDASCDELAQKLKSRYSLLARMQGAALGVPAAAVPGAGAVVAVLPDLVSLAWIQSRMVVHIAAVYGHDPTERERAAELLVLQGIYGTTEAARVALAKAGTRVAGRVVKRYVVGTNLKLLKHLFRYVGIRFTRTGLLKAVPYVSVPISAVVNEAATRSLANRAITFYDLGPRRG